MDCHRHRLRTRRCLNPPRHQSAQTTRIRLAATAYERGDTAKALDALRRASTAAESRDYFPETLAMLERALDAAGGHAFPQRVDLAFTLAGANLPAYESYVGMCSKQSKVDAEWAQTCLFGEYLDAMREHGERAALEQARVEGNRLAELCSQRRTH